jgi:hypothetical protein
MMLVQATVCACYILSPLLTNLLCIDENTVVEAAKYEHGILTQALAASQPEGNVILIYYFLANYIYRNSSTVVP